MIYIELQHHKWQPGAWVKNPWESESADVGLSACDWELRYWSHNSICEAKQKSNYRSMNWKFGPWAKADRLVKELVSKQPIIILRCRLSVFFNSELIHMGACCLVVH